jgi:hypothetical protein
MGIIANNGKITYINNENRMEYTGINKYIWQRYSANLK